MTLPVNQANTKEVIRDHILVNNFDSAPMAEVFALL